jgi:hypothetical protein
MLLQVRVIPLVRVEVQVRYSGAQLGCSIIHYSLCCTQLFDAANRSQEQADIFPMFLVR